MRAPLSWLSELTPLGVDPADRTAVVALGSELDALGLVVERTEWVGQGLDDVVLAQVVEIAAIEGADRIRRVVVDAGGEEPVEVVCGAWNFHVGDVVPLAPVGAVLPGEFEITRRKMKGVTSNGMLCSGRELALSEDHEGILVLDSPGEGAATSLELGLSLAEHLGGGLDVVFDLDVEPNRPDCLSIAGIARDLASRFGLPLALPEPVLVEADPPAADLATLEIIDGELCRRITGRVLTGIVPVPSPATIRRRLLICGMRPLGHVVDATNYVMLEFGQPTHTYDLDKVRGGGLRVRAARPGEQLVTLDGETRTVGNRLPRGGDPFTALDGLICDGEDHPVGLAGVMGGLESEISDATSRVLLEAAWFEPVAVGRTARSTGLRSEASLRFERGIDPEGIARASARVCELVVAAQRAAGVAEPVVHRGLVDATARPFEPTRLGLRTARANQLLGLELDEAGILSLLEPIGYTEDRTSGGEGTLGLAVPSWRPDVTREVDLVEEVARTFGYRRIPKRNRRSPYVGRLDEIQQLRRRLRRILAGLGADEAWTSSIVEPEEQAAGGVDRPLLRLANPMVAEESVLRGGLLPGLLKALRHNAGHRNGEIRLFEIGDVFAAGASSDGTVHEHEVVAVLLAREADDAAAAVAAWRVVEDALGLATARLAQPGFRAVPDHSAGRLAGLHPARSSLVVAGEDEAPAVLGALGEIDPAVLAAFGLQGRRVGYLELDLAALSGAPRRPVAAQPVSRFPSSDIDIAFSVEESVPAAAVREALAAAAGELCESVQLFDVYRGSGLEEGRRSLAFRMRLCALDRTLTDAEVAEVRARVITSVEASLPASLR